MYKILRVICAVIAAVLVTACIFLAIYISETMVPALGCAAGALLFFVLCLLFRHLQEEKEGKKEVDAVEIPFETKKPDAGQTATDGQADKPAPAPGANDPQDDEQK